MDQRTATINTLLRLIDLFLAGPDRTRGAAAGIEVMLDQTFPEDDRINDFVLALAMYAPEGGEHLYNEGSIQPILREAKEYLLALLQEH